MSSSTKRIASFLIMAYAISWSIVGIGVALGTGPSQPLGYMLMAGLSMFGPALAAIIQQRLLDRAPWSGLGIHLKGVHWRQVAWTAVIGLSIIPLALLVAMGLGDGLGIEAFGHVSITQERLLTSIGEMMAGSGVKSNALATVLEGHHLPGALLLVGLALVTLLVACTVNLPVMMGEELGWRGYLFQATQHWSGARRVLFTGVVWGLWHAPLIAMGHNYPEHPMLGIGLMVVFCILLASTVRSCALAQSGPRGPPGFCMVVSTAVLGAMCSSPGAAVHWSTHRLAWRVSSPWSCSGSRSSPSTRTYREPLSDADDRSGPAPPIGD